MTPEAFTAAVARLGVSHSEFARLVGKDRTTISRYAQGSQSVPRAIQALLAVAKPGDLPRLRALTEEH